MINQWTASQVLLCALWAATAALVSGYTVRAGLLGLDQLVFTLFAGSVVAVGIHDTRHNQPTPYNLLRSWPFGSAAGDDARKRSVSSQALHAAMCVSVCLCLGRIVIAHR
jgi:hypothetical protein